MTHHDNDRRNFDEAPAPRRAAEASPGWGIPLGIAAIALIAGVIIFSAAGPDRTRTAQFNNPNAKPTASEPARPVESAIPQSNAPASAPAPTAPAQKSNPAGTQ